MAYCGNLGYNREGKQRREWYSMGEKLMEKDLGAQVGEECVWFCGGGGGGSGLAFDTHKRLRVRSLPRPG